MRGWKVFTHDLRPPVQGGEPVWDGTLPHVLPVVKVDRSAAACARGWNFARLPETAFRVAGLWPDGRPSRLFAVEAEDTVEAGDKVRASSLSIVREATPEEVTAAISALSAVFAPHSEWMLTEQLEWRAALARPACDEAALAAGLSDALVARGLAWQLRRFDTTWDAWAARAAWDAWDALTHGFASRQGWVKDDALLLTRGIRDAYRNGLEIAIPTGPTELGWSLR